MSSFDSPIRLDYTNLDRGAGRVNDGDDGQ
jgi:hypothetical protein